MKFIRIPIASLLLIGATSFITAETRLPTNVTVLTPEDFIGRHYFSVGDALRGTPSLKLEQVGSRGTQITAKMRGLSSSNNVLVLLDGRPLTHEYNSTVDLAQIPLAMVERIEIIRGGSPVAFGSEAVGGTINIITYRPDRKGLVTDAATGVGRDGEKKTSLLFRGRSNFGDFTYAPSLEYSGGFQDNEDFKTNNHFGNFTRSFGGRGYWGAEYYFHESRVGLSNGTPVPFDEWNGKEEELAVTPTAQGTEESQHAKLFLAYPLVAGGTTYATFTQSWRNNKEKLTRDGVAIHDEDTRNSMLDISWRKSAWDLGFRSENLKRQIFPYDADYATKNGFYATTKWKISRLTLAPGVRYDYHSRSGGFWAPRLAVIYEPADKLLLSSTIQRAHRTPNFDELFLSSAVSMNSNLEDEKSTNADLGFAWTPTKHIQIKSTAFSIKKSDVISPDATSTWANGGTEKSKGIETELTLDVSGNSKKTNVFTVNWTAQKSRRSLPNAPANVDAAMSPHDLIAGKWDIGMPYSLTLTNEVRYQSDQYELDNQQGTKIPSSYVWNARISAKILAADAYFEVDNITRRRYAETVGDSSLLSPQPDRTFWTGVSIRFIN